MGFNAEYAKGIAEGAKKRGVLKLLRGQEPILFLIIQGLIQGAFNILQYLFFEDNGIAVSKLVTHCPRYFGKQFDELLQCLAILLEVSRGVGL